MTTRVPLNSLRYRPLPPKRGKFSYLLYGIWGFSIVEGDEQLNAAPDGALAYAFLLESLHRKRRDSFHTESKIVNKIPWSAVTAVVFKISPFGSSSIFFELHKMPYRYLFCTNSLPLTVSRISQIAVKFDNEFAPGLEKGTPWCTVSWTSR